MGQNRGYSGSQTTYAKCCKNGWVWQVDDQDYKNTFPRDSYLARYAVGEGVETWKEESPIVRSNYFAVITNIQKEEINDTK